MNNEDRTLWFVEWTYSPPDYFEEPIRIVHEHYELTIQNGKAEARISAEHGDPRPKVLDQMNKDLNLRFVGIQLISHQQYELSRPLVYRRHPDGKRDIYFKIEDIVTMSSVSADFKIMGGKGNVVADSRAERIERKRYLATLAATHGGRDLVAKGILQSYSRAVKDPGNELIHLYEIRDALAKVFGGKQQAINALRVSEERWQELGRLANDAPLRQGRHRGKTPSGLRDASNDELDMARDIAREMVENYLKYLDEK